MTAFTLYGGPGSTYTKRVRLMLAETGVDDYEIILLNLMKGEHKTPEHMKRHPWGKVPVAVFPNGPTLYESRVICRYLAKQYSSPLLPSESDIHASASFDQAQAVEMTYFSEPAGSLAYEKYAKKRRGLVADEKAVAAALQSLETYFNVAEDLLQRQEYMAGNEFTLVDIYYIPLVERLFQVGHGDLINSRKAVDAWWERVTSRPAIAKLLAEDIEAAAREAAARGQ